MTQERNIGRGGVLAIGLVVLVTACATNPEINEVYLQSDGVTIEFGIDSCNADLDALVVESEATVEVTITATSDTPDDCADSIIIMLNEPLGDRQLLNGSTGDVLDVRPSEN